jgi:phenylacetate-CoA ligase
MEIQTSLAAELDEQRRTWRLLPQYAHLGWFDELVHGEFRPEPELASMQAAALRKLARHAVQEVPYYREAFARLALRADDVQSASSLALLPVLTKTELHEYRDMLRARDLPSGETLAGWFHSTGTTTGRPTEVMWTARCRTMFAVLKQREARWFRFDPQRIFGELRLESLLPGHPGGPGSGTDTRVQPRWPSVGVFFHTGQAVAGSSERPVDEIQAWIEKHRVAT